MIRKFRILLFVFALLLAGCGNDGRKVTHTWTAHGCSISAMCKDFSGKIYEGDEAKCPGAQAVINLYGKVEPALIDQSTCVVTPQ